jgi:hypothetical protein
MAPFASFAFVAWTTKVSIYHLCAARNTEDFCSRAKCLFLDNLNPRDEAFLSEFQSHFT